MKDSPVKDFNDDKLLAEFMDWTRIYRNEGELKEDDRKYFKSVVKEVNKRNLMAKHRTK
jgi:hypothetical protein